MTVPIPPDFLLSVSGRLLEVAHAPSKEERRRETAFLDLLVRTFSDLLAPYRWINNSTPTETHRMTESLLAAINGIVRNYREITGDDPGEVNSCYMTPVLRKDFTDDVIKNLLFVDTNRDLRTELYAALKIEQWGNSKPALPVNKYLPVEDHSVPDRSRHLLFGAPRAFANVTPEFVDDTLKPVRTRRKYQRWIKQGPPSPGRFFLPHDLPEAVVKELAGYFARYDQIRSFVSLPLLIPPEDRESYPAEYSDIPLAILNIQSSKRHLLGHGGSRARGLLGAIVPVLNVLARYISRVRLAPA